MISFDTNKFDGLLLHENSIPTITKYIYDNLINTKNRNLSIKKSRISFYFYTFYKIEDVVLFYMCLISMNLCRISRDDFDKKYGREPYSCWK